MRKNILLPVLSLFILCFALLVTVPKILGVLITITAVILCINYLFIDKKFNLKSIKYKATTILIIIFMLICGIGLTIINTNVKL